MGQRYQSGATNISAGTGVIFPHGLTGTPTEFVAAKMDGGTGQPYFSSVASTNMTVIGNGVACSANVQASIPHTIIQ